MASPFPGMDPYLEGEMWQEFHERPANQISAQLMPQLDYSGPPPPPELSDEDTFWVEQRLRDAGLRDGPDGQDQK